jgi:hypothetical protein
MRNKGVSWGEGNGGIFYNKGNGVGLATWESFQFFSWLHGPRISNFRVMLAQELICGFFVIILWLTMEKMMKLPKWHRKFKKLRGTRLFDVYVCSKKFELIMRNWRCTYSQSPMWYHSYPCASGSDVHRRARLVVPLSAKLLIFQWEVLGAKLWSCVLICNFPNNIIMIILWLTMEKMIKIPKWHWKFKKRRGTRLFDVYVVSKKFELIMRNWRCTYS